MNTGFYDKIRGKATGVTSTTPPLINTIFYKGENSVTSKTVSKICRVEGCEKNVRARSLCINHYNQLRKTSKFKRIRLPFVRGIGDTISQRFWSRIAVTANPDRCWEWLGSRTKQGYGSVQHNGALRRAHRVAWEVFHGRKPQGFLLHSCDNPPCCNPAHLREGSHLDNAGDRVQRNRQTKGEDVSISRLTAQDVLQIRAAWVPIKVSQQTLARKYGVSRYTISDIITRKTWRHI